MRTLLATALAFVLSGQAGALAQAGSSQVQTPKPPAPPTPAVLAASISTEPGFTIGPDDVLGVVFWRDADMSGDVTVRPDGKITLPLLRDIEAAGLTPVQLADRIQEAARGLIKEPSVTVIVRQMNSRKVFITGEVVRPGVYPLTTSMTVIQLVALAGGLTEWADPKSISVMRIERGQTSVFPFDYIEVAKGSKPQQNILLKPGDTIVVREK